MACFLWGPLAATILVNLAPVADLDAELVQAELAKALSR